MLSHVWLILLHFAQLQDKHVYRSLAVSKVELKYRLCGWCRVVVAEKYGKETSSMRQEAREWMG